MAAASEAPAYLLIKYATIPAAPCIYICTPSEKRSDFAFTYIKFFKIAPRCTIIFHSRKLCSYMYVPFTSREAHCLAVRYNFVRFPCLGTAPSTDGHSMSIQIPFVSISSVEPIAFSFYSLPFEWEKGPHGVKKTWR